MPHAHKCLQAATAQQCTGCHLVKPGDPVSCVLRQMASKAVAKRSSVMDGELFLMKQLLILREQIAPFDAEFSVVEKDLDFTHMRDYLRRILAGKRGPVCLEANCRSRSKRAIGTCWQSIPGN